MAERLSAKLYQVSLSGGLLTGRDMRFEIIDGDLHFFVTYTLLVYAPAPDDPDMRTLDHKEGIK
ncbi:hypothetical protein D3C81_2317960 [compost metagenome]